VWGVDVNKGWEVVLFSICAGLLATVIGVVGALVGMAVSKSRFAFWAGLVACAVTAGCMILGLHYHAPFSSEAYWILSIAMPVGLLAILVSFRPALWWLGEVTEHRGGTHVGEGEPGTVRTRIASRAVRVTVVLGCAGIVSVGTCMSWFRPGRDFGRLLRGDGQVELVAVEFDGHGQRVALRDAASLAYLSDRLRSAQRDRAELGTTYYATMGLSTGGSVRCAVYIPGKEASITVRFPIDALAEGDMYLVPLPEPVPRELAAVLAALR
jgi:hypothetical protein